MDLGSFQGERVPKQQKPAMTDNSTENNADTAKQDTPQAQAPQEDTPQSEVPKQSAPKSATSQNSDATEMQHTDRTEKQKSYNERDTTKDAAKTTEADDQTKQLEKTKQIDEMPASNEAVNRNDPPQEPKKEQTNVAEQPPEQTEPRVRYEGSFVDADETVRTSGRALILDDGKNRYVRLEDFAASKGPDLFVVLAQENSPSGDGVSLGALKGNKGNQNYVLPADVDIEKYNTVVIWCRAFDHDFGYARLMRIE